MGRSIRVAVRLVTKSRTAWRVLLLMIAIATWLGCFAVLARRGTWTVFALTGPMLAALAYRFDPGLPALLRPSLAKAGVGLLAGAAMVMLTHAAFALLTVRLPQTRAATVRLYDLLNVGGFSAVARASLVVVIATSEEIVFRGALAGSGRNGNGGERPDGVNWRGLSRIAALAACYAAATLTLGSLLLSACAFLCGVAWGGLRVATRSLVPPIAAHIVWDLGVLLVWPLI